MKNAAIYVRVSTAEQNEHGYSVDEQRERLISYCKAMGWNMSGVYVDGGYSGSDTNRPGLQKLIQEIKQFDVVVVYKLDRLSRRQKDTLFIIEDVLIKNGVDIVSLVEHLDTTTPFGRAAIGILAAFAQLERETFKERSLLGRTGRARKGLWVGTSRPPIGYDYNVEQQELVINYHEAEQVKKVFDMYLSGKGLELISRTMHQAGYTHKYGNWLSWGGVITMLRNPVYIGKVVFDGKEFDGQHTPIIDVDDFNKVQELIEQRRTNQLHKRKSPFSHLLHCGNCGAKMFYRKKTGREPTYYCYSRYGRPLILVKDKTCKMRIEKCQVIDEFVKSQIEKIYSDKVAILNIVNKSTPDVGLKRRSTEIEKEITKLLELYKHDGIPADRLNIEIKKLHDEKTSITSLLTATKKDKPQVQEIKNIARTIIKEWDNLPIEGKIEFLSALISKIIVHQESIEIIWTFERSGQ